EAHGARGRGEEDRRRARPHREAHRRAARLQRGPAADARVPRAPQARPRHMSTVLVANRGEIARRIIRTARRVGMRAVAVYSDADERLPFVREADAAVRLGPAPARESYLDPERILAAARVTGAELIHPGYGFLAESAVLARAVID